MKPCCDSVMRVDWVLVFWVVRVLVSVCFPLVAPNDLCFSCSRAVVIVVVIWVLSVGC